MPASPERYAPGAARGAVDAFFDAAGTLSREILEREWTADEAWQLLDSVAGARSGRREAGALLFKQAARDPQLLVLPPPLAAEALLRLLLLLSPPTDASLWLDPTGPPVPALGEPAPSWTVRRVARETLDGGLAVPRREGQVQGPAVPVCGEPCAALALRAARTLAAA